MPRRTIRLRLTTLYGGLFLLSGTVLLVITHVLSRTVFEPPRPVINGLLPPPPIGPLGEADDAIGPAMVALAFMSLVAIGLGWLVAGRILRPLRLITATTRHISSENLHERLSVPAPDDELKDLGDTIDALLQRLETAFEAQKRFVANASHELRTPLTVQRAMIEVAIADPDANAETLRTTCQELLAVGQQQERVIEALLTLAHSQQGLSHRAQVDLAAVAHQVAAGHPEVTTLLGPAWTSGDPRLVERLLTNLVDNARRYNVPDGQCVVTTSTQDEAAVVSVTNAGPEIPESKIPRLLQPFQRMTADRTGEHSGLGLSIVAAIAKAHDAVLHVRPNPGGGLHIEVRFPASRSA